LLAAGVKNIEAGSFVSPRAVPAMMNTDKVLAGLVDQVDACLTVLIPNMKGYELASAAGATRVSMVAYTTDSMAEKNAGMNRATAEQITGDIVQRARNDQISVSATIAVAYECPFDGPVDPAVTQRICGRLFDLGVNDVVLADTIGAANPKQVSKLTASVVNMYGAERLGCHFHDTRAMGLANVYAALESGIRKFDSSIGGLGGCPFAPGASGNVATEDVVMMLEQMGYVTGIDLGRLMEVSQLAKELTGSAPGGRAAPWIERSLKIAS
jgi:hydroxymethylglutaryl-CoA lyase